MFDRSMFTSNPYGLERKAKQRFLTERLQALTIYHYHHCSLYARMMDAWPFVCHDPVTSYMELPFLPVRLFKEYRLSSVNDSKIVEELNSSGTTGQTVSRILLDDQTAEFQSRLLSWMLASHIGKSRLPMIVLDTQSILHNPQLFSARGAGILGFSFLATDRMFALDDAMEFNVEGVQRFVEKHRGEHMLLFGFTFIIWQHVCLSLKKRGIRLDINNGQLFHGGGWKRMSEMSVDNSIFKTELHETLGVKQVHNFYGMVEQTGTIHIECTEGHLHAPDSADIIIRRPKDYSVAEIGEEGVIQACSIAPLSYPGHLLLTDDLGVVLGEDDCPCGRKGKYFAVKGRIQHAELRGCSDSYAKHFE